MAQFGLADPLPLAQTAIAGLWQVRRSDGSAAVLKHYLRPDRGNEAAGTALLSAWADRGAVHILEETDTTVLMEYLEGPSLGDIARSGAPDHALRLLADTASRLHAAPVASVPGLQPLAQVFEPLLTLSQVGTEKLCRDLTRAADLARHLLSSQPDPVPLHGDLHPENVIVTSDGPRVIDAKGYLGDPGFELANALRHPRGMPRLVRNRDHIVRTAERYACAMNVDPSRLLQWAAAKCALSIVWRAHGNPVADDEADLLRTFLDLSGQ